MQEDYIAARMAELAGVFRPGGKTPTPGQLREFTLKMMREDCNDAGIEAGAFDAALDAGDIAALHARAREISVSAFQAHASRRDKVRNLQLAGILLLFVCFMVFLYTAF